MVKWKRNDTHDYQSIGTLGVVHPTVLEKFAIGFPTTVLELNIEPFIRE